MLLLTEEKCQNKIASTICQRPYRKFYHSKKTTYTRIVFIFSYANGNLTWLQRQQQKLKERKEMRLKEERQPHETRLFSELKQVQTRHMKPTASHRLGRLIITESSLIQ